MSLAQGSSWPTQLGNLPQAFFDVWHVSMRAAALTYVLPFAGALIAISGFCISIVQRDGRRLRTLVQVVGALMVVITVVISALLHGVPYFAVVFLPLGFALYSSRDT
jgi:hypothetical protein